jgi:Meiotically up-regulated gene 113
VGPSLTLPTGIVRTKTGYRAFVWVPDPDRPSGRIKTKRWKRDASLAEMKAWREAQRVEARKSQFDPTLPPVNWKRLQPSPRGWCYVYFVRAGDRIKIGRAVDPAQRFRGLQVAHPEELSLVLTIPAHAELERAIHARFEHLQERGEWFRLEPDLVAFIEAVQQGANPITLLW